MHCPLFLLGAPLGYVAPPKEAIGGEQIMEFLHTMIRVTDLDQNEITDERKENSSAEGLKRLLATQYGGPKDAPLKAGPIAG